MLNRFANIFWHYYSGPLYGFKQRLWPVERVYPLSFQWLALILYLGQLGILIFGHPPILAKAGLALILFSPQWLYAFHTLPYPVFEYRGYGMAAGVSLIAVEVLRRFPIVLVPLAIVWFVLTVRRSNILVSPLRFWEAAEKENHGP